MKEAYTALIFVLGWFLGAVWPSNAGAQQSFPPYKPTTNEFRAQSQFTTEDRVGRLEQRVNVMEDYLAELYNLAGKDGPSPALPAPPSGGMPPVEPPAATMPVYGGQYHVIQEGETLPSIAQKYAVPLDEMLAVNKVDRYGVTPLAGQKLWIPAANQSPKAPKPEVGKGTTTHPAEWTASYQVKQGDTLYSIARRCGVTAAEVAQHNRLPKADQILPGQILLLPGSQAPMKVSRPETQTPPPQAAAAQPEETYHYYKVTAGDTLSELARTFYTNESEIKRINQLPGNQLQVGQQIVVPTRLYLENEKQRQQQQQQKQQSPVS